MILRQGYHLSFSRKLNMFDDRCTENVHCQSDTTNEPRSVCVTRPIRGGMRVSSGREPEHNEVRMRGKVYNMRKIRIDEMRRGPNGSVCCRNDCYAPQCILRFSSTFRRRPSVS